MVGVNRALSMKAKRPVPLAKSLIQDNIPVEVIPGLFIGSVHAAFNRVILDEIGISHIVNCAGIPETYPEAFRYLNVKIKDREEECLLSFLPAVLPFIKSALQGKGQVLVHCTLGKSRAAAFIVAYLLHERIMDFEAALSFVKSRRHIVGINDGFKRQLKAYEVSGYCLKTAKQILYE